MKRLQVKVLARIGGKSSGEAGLLKRVLRYDAATEGFFWCDAKRDVQNAAAALQLTPKEPRVQDGRHSWHEGHWATLRDGDQKLDGNEDSRLPGRPGISGRHEILYATKTAFNHAISDEVGDGQAQVLGSLSAAVPTGRGGLLQTRCAEVPGCVR